MLVDSESISSGNGACTVNPPRPATPSTLDIVEFNPHFLLLFHIPPSKGYFVSNVTFGNKTLVRITM